MQSVGLSMALGAFLAGVLLAESEYRRALETDLEPFKGLLLGLFFIAVGMSIDFAVVLAHPLAMAGVVLGFLLLKALVLWALARWTEVPLLERPVYLVLLAQGGEFGFVVFQTALQARVITAEQSSFLIAAVAVSMLLSPLLLLVADRWWVPRLTRHAERHGAPKPAEISEPQAAPVIIAGFGRYGQIVGRLLNANGLSATVLEHNADQVETLRRFGWQVFYGDAARLDLLRVAGAAQARVFVLAIDDVDQSLQVAAMVREHFPHLEIVARARNVTHYGGLRKLGITRIEREVLDASLLSGRSVLELLGWHPHAARTQAMRFRAHTIDLLDQLVPHMGDEQKLIAMAKQGRQQLETMWAQERADDSDRQKHRGWQPDAPD
jgi:glutathione-regulated potassium-efflux system ancillary protein KefC